MSNRSENFKPLSSREKEVAILIAKGYKNYEIAEKLYISRRRIVDIIISIKNKWQVKTRVEIGIICYHLGYIELKQDVMDKEKNRVE